MWLIILTIIIVTETFALIILTVKLLRKEKTEVVSALRIAEKALDKVPTSLDPKNPPIIPKEDIKKLEESTPLMYEIKGLINPSLLIKLGNVEYTTGNLLKALTYFNEALEQAKSTKDSITSGICLGNIGLIYKAKGDSDTALKYHEEALKIDREIGYKQGEANQLGNIGIIYKAKGDSDTALKYLQDALKIIIEFKLEYGKNIIVDAINELEIRKTKVE